MDLGGFVKNAMSGDLSTKNLISELAHEYAEICASKRNCDNRDLWRRHNNFEKTPIPILCDWHSASEAHPLAEKCVSNNSSLWYIEFVLRNKIAHAKVGDDQVFEPWITIPAMYSETPVRYNQQYGRNWMAEGGLWGDKSIIIEQHVGVNLGRKAPKSEVVKIFSNYYETNSVKVEPTIYNLDDAKELTYCHHKINRAASKIAKDYIDYVVGGHIGVNIDTRPMYAFPWFGSDISTAMSKMVGLENMMYMMYDQPEVLHYIASFMQKAIIEVFDEAEKAGDWYTGDEFYTNVGMPYGAGVLEPSLEKGKKMKDLWFFTHGQEFTLISPEMHNEFLFQYQLPIMEKFGACSYGCCEDLSTKIDMLKQCKNLKKISVTPSANVKKCAEQIERDYLFSWKPKPAYICANFDEEATRKYLRQGLEDSRDCHVDIMMKDITTLQGDMTRPKRWTDICREECDRLL